MSMQASHCSRLFGRFNFSLTFLTLGNVDASITLFSLIRKVGRVIDRAGLEIRYTPFGYRGFESLTFRQEKPNELHHWTFFMAIGNRFLQKYNVKIFQNNLTIFIMFKIFTKLEV